jgi:H/ACA ribonucleoprotein complex subunit 3
MRTHKCSRCNSYTLKDVCPKCGGQAFRAKPPGFSPQDPYGKYRRMMKKAQADVESVC